MKDIVICVLLSLMVMSCALDESSVKKGEKIPLKNVVAEVEVEDVKKGVFYKEVISNGVLAASQKAELRFESTGLIKEIRFKNGDYVNEGSVIAILSNVEQASMVSRAKLAYQSAELRLEDILIGMGYNLEDTSRLSSYVLENLYVKSGFLERALDLETAKRNYETTKLKAPFSGKIADLSTYEDNYSSTKTFCRIVNNNKFLIRFPVMESDVASLEIGDEVSLQSYFSNSIHVDGKVNSINPLVDKNGLIEITATISVETTDLLDGMKMKVFIKKPVRNKLIVRKSAVVLRGEKPVIFTYKEGKSHWNYVEIGLENYKYVTVDKGINVGDSVIVTGNVHLGDNVKVKLKN